MDQRITIEHPSSQKWLSIKKIVIAALVSLSLSGCAFNSLFSSYPAQVAEAKAQLSQPSTAAVYEDFSDQISTADGLLYAQEAGRMAQILGDFNTSINYYYSAINDYKKFDDKAVISASDVGATASSLLLNDKVIPYRGPGYERIMLHQYQALNYLFSGNSQDALVEVRRSNELQSSEQERYQKSNTSVQALSNGTINAEINRLDQAAGSTTSSFLNAYSYYTTGLLYELLGSPNDAFIDYRKAAQINPGNHYLQQDLVRLAKQLAMPQYDDFRRRWGEPVSRKKNEGQVVLLLERGFVPEKQSFTVPFTIGGNLQTASLATYYPDRYFSKPPQIIGLGSVLKPAAIANIDALAITALKEDLPAALLRQAARIYAKSELARSVPSDKSNIGNVAVQVFNIFSEQADRRSWLTLPSQASIARKYVAQGYYSIRLKQSLPTTIEVKKGRTTLVWIIVTGNYPRFYSIII